MTWLNKQWTEREGLVGNYRIEFKELEGSRQPTHCSWVTKNQTTNVNIEYVPRSRNLGERGVLVVVIILSE